MGEHSAEANLQRPDLLQPASVSRALAARPKKLKPTAVDFHKASSKTDREILATFAAMRSSLRPGGKVLVSVRDYARHLQEKHTCMPPVFYSDNGRRRIVFQVWDWIDERRYVVHVYVTQETVENWIVHHFTGRYRAVTPEEIARLANQAGLQEVCVLSSSNTSFYQPIIVAVAA